MATDTLQDINLTNQWQDIVATLPGAASIDLVIQNIGNLNIQVVQGGVSAPVETKSGTRVPAGGTVYVNNAHVWVRAYGSPGLISLNPL